jgi:hypothetical protein
MKSIFLSFASAVALFSSVDAATYVLSNVDQGPGDTLYATGENSLITGGILSIGYFNAGFDVVANLNDYAALTSNFVILASSGIGGYGATLDGSFAGYADTTVQGLTYASGDALIGSALYSFIGNSATLGASNELALLDLGKSLAADSPTNVTYSVLPTGISPLIGTQGSYVGDAGAGQGSYLTLKLAAIPEPSTMLLGAFGALGLLRRRR